MSSLLAKLLKNPQLLLGLGVTLIVATLIVFALLLISPGNQANPRVDLAESAPRQLETIPQAFAVQKITIRKDGQTIEILSNGVVTRSSLDLSKIQDRKLVSSNKILSLFGSLTLEEFLALATQYFSATQNLTIVIETTYGTKTKPTLSPSATKYA